MNFIEELYYSNIRPQSATLSDRRKQASDIVSKISEQLRSTLAEPERTLLERLLEAEDEIAEETGLSDFKLGFSLGIQMMVDSFIL